jgi:hypothetical protein
MFSLKLHNQQWVELFTNNLHGSNYLLNIRHISTVSTVFVEGKIARPNFIIG